MSINVGELEVKVGGDTRDAERGIDGVSAGFAELQAESKKLASHLRLVSSEMTTVGTSAAPSAARAVESVNKSTQATRGNLGALARSLTTAGGAMGSMGGRAASLVSTLMGGFAMGGAIGLGVGAAISGFQMLAAEIRETQKQGEQLRVMRDVLGTTENDVKRVERAFKMAGVEVDRSLVQNLIVTAREAGTSTVELAAMADEIKRIQQLTGKDVGAAAAQAAAASGRAEAGAYLEDLKKTAKARQDEFQGLSDWQVTLEEGYRRDSKRLDEVTRKITNLRQQEGRAVADYGFQSDKAEELRNQIAAHIAERTELRKRLGEAERLEANLTLHDEIEADEKSADAYVARVNRERAEAEAESRRRKTERDRQAQEEERTITEVASAEADLLTRTRVLQAQAVEDRKAEINALADHEIQKAAEVAWKHVELAEQVRAHIKALNDKRDADLNQVDADAAKASAKQAADARKEMDRSISESASQAERAQIAGIQAGASFVQGLRQGIQNNDPMAIFRGILQAAAGIFSAAGNPVAGAGLSAFSSFFHSGGMIGTGGTKLPKYHDGGMLVAHQGLMLPQPGPGEVPIMAQLGEGVLSRKGVSAAGGPSAVNALNNGQQPATQGGSTTIQVVAFDPRGMRQVIASTVEPAQYQRGMSRQDSKTMRGLQRRVRAPRTGMV